MLVRLRELEAAWPDDVPADSPTRRVGGKVNPEFTEVDVYKRQVQGTDLCRL